MSQYGLRVNRKAVQRILGRGGYRHPERLWRDGRSVSVAALKALEAVEGSIEATEGLHRHNDRAFLYAFDLIELNGDDLRRDPLEVRKATLRSMLAKAGLGLRFNEHIEGDGPTVFAHA
jgi:ATP-dependent DNA ligase